MRVENGPEFGPEKQPEIIPSYSERLSEERKNPALSCLGQLVGGGLIAGGAVALGIGLTPPDLGYLALGSLAVTIGIGLLAISKQ